MVVKDLRAQRYEAIDLRVTVPVIRLKAHVDPILHSLALRNGLEKQPGTVRWLDDDLGVARKAFRVDGVADHLAPKLCQGVGVSAVERNIPNKRHHDWTA
jgi:hypothetical protein